MFVCVYKNLFNEPSLRARRSSMQLTSNAFALSRTDILAKIYEGLLSYVTICTYMYSSF